MSRNKELQKSKNPETPQVGMYVLLKYLTRPFPKSSTIYNEGLLERIFDVPRCGFWYNTYQQIGSFSGTEDIIYKNVKFRQNMSGFGSALLKKMAINQPDLPLTPCNFSWIFHRESKSFNPEPWTQWDKSICEIAFEYSFSHDMWQLNSYHFNLQV